MNKNKEKILKKFKKSVDKEIKREYNTNCSRGEREQRTLKSKQ